MTGRAAMLGATALLALRCASQPNDPSQVRVTRDPSEVKPCIDLARVKTALDDVPGENDLKLQAFDLGGNVLLVYNAHEGGAFYCGGKRPPDITKTSPGAANPIRSLTPRP